MKIPAGVVAVDRESWSDASRRSTAYDYAKPEYEDVHFSCKRCDVPVCYTATQQKAAFECRGAYIWQRRMLCQSCFEVRMALVKETRELLSRWRSNRNAMRTDRPALERLRSLLQVLPSYGVRQDLGNLSMLNKLLGGAI